MWVYCGGLAFTLYVGLLNLVFVILEGLRLGLFVGVFSCGCCCRFSGFCLSFRLLGVMDL